MKQASNSSIDHDGGKRRTRHARSTVDAFDDPQVALGRISQNRERCLIRRTIVCSAAGHEQAVTAKYHRLVNGR